MARFYYSNPALGVGISNLAEAMAGDPLSDVKAGLLGDQRGVQQVQRRKLEAEALSKEIENRETLAAQAQLATVISNSIAGLPPEQQAAAASQLEYVLRAGGGNASQLAGAFQKSVGLGYAQGDDDDMRRSLVIGGKAPGAGFAGTAARADAVSGRDAEESLAQALAVAGEQRAGAMDRQISANDAAMARTQVTEKGKDRRKTTTGGTPLNVGAGALKGIDTLIDTAVATVGEEMGFDTVSLDPGARQQLNLRTAELYQTTRNMPVAAAQAWQEIMGADPQFEPTDEVSKDRWWPLENEYVQKLKPTAVKGNKSDPAGRPPLSSFRTPQ